MTLTVWRIVSLYMHCYINQQAPTQTLTGTYTTVLLILQPLTPKFFFTAVGGSSRSLFHLILAFANLLMTAGKDQQHRGVEVPASQPEWGSSRALFSIWRLWRRLNVTGQEMDN